MDAKLNLIDTPGYLDFTGEALAACTRRMGRWWWSPPRAASRWARKRSGTYCEKREIPRLFFVSLMDKEHADFEKVYTQIKERLTPKVIRLEIPVGEGPSSTGSSTCFSKQVPPLQEGHEGRRVRGRGRAARVSGTVRALLQGADRADRRNRRYAARALPGRRGDRTGRGDRRHEGGHC